MYICIWLLAFGLNKILFTHRNHKLSKQEQETQKQYAYLSVTYIYKMTITQTPTIARWQIIVKTSEATKQTKDQNDNKKQTKQKQQQQQNGRRGRISLNTAHIICSAVGCNLQLYHVKPKVSYLHGMGFCYRRITKSRR